MFLFRSDLVIHQIRPCDPPAAIHWTWLYSNTCKYFDGPKYISVCWLVKVIVHQLSLKIQIVCVAVLNRIVWRSSGPNVCWRMRRWKELLRGWITGALISSRADAAPVTWLASVHMALCNTGHMTTLAMEVHDLVWWPVVRALCWLGLWA